MNDQLRRIVESPWIQIAVYAFVLGMAWADLHAEIRENKMAADARVAALASDVHALKVLACRAYPQDSVCVP